MPKITKQNNALRAIAVFSGENSCTKNTVEYAKKATTQLV